MNENNGDGNDNQSNDQQPPTENSQADAPQTLNGGSEQQGSGTGQSGANAQSGEKRRWPEPVRWDYPGPTYSDGDHWRLEDKDAVIQMRKERREEHQRKTRENWLQTRQGKLCMEFYQKFQEYRKYLEQNKWAWNTEWGAPVEYTEHKLFELGLREIQRQKDEREERDRKNLQRAQLAARCEHVHDDGQRCGCPRVKGAKLCYMHQRIEEARALKLDLGPMEDPDSIQVGIKRLQKAVIDETLNDKQVRQLTNLIQIATWNVTRVRFANRETEES